jgi:tellurite resistance protein
MLTTNTFGSVGNHVNEEFRAALKVALADGEINKAEQEKLNEIRNRNSSNYLIPIRTNPSRGFQFDDREFGLAQKLIKAILSGNKDKANRILAKLTTKLDFDYKVPSKFYHTKAHDPIIDAYDTAIADGEISKKEVAILKQLVEA